MNRALLIAAALLFLIIFPYTKTVDRFRADDITWAVLNTSLSYKEFDPKVFAFRDTYQISPALKKLHGKEILIKGFLKHHKHKGHRDLILTEKAGNVCFMCDHDEQSVFITVYGKEGAPSFKATVDESYVQLKGVFQILSDNEHGIFQLKDAVILKNREEIK